MDGPAACPAGRDEGLADGLTDAGLVDEGLAGVAVFACATVLAGLCVDFAAAGSCAAGFGVAGFAGAAFGAAFAACFVVFGLAFGFGVGFGVGFDFRAALAGAGDFVVAFGFVPPVCFVSTVCPPAKALDFASRAGVALAGGVDLRGCCLAAEAVA